MNIVKQTILLLGIVALVLPLKAMGEKKYPLIWPEDKGTTIFWRQVFTNETKRFYLDEQMKKIVRKVPYKHKVKLTYIALWQIADKIGEDKNVITWYSLNGTIAIRSGSRNSVLQVNNPRHARKLKNPMFRPWVNRVKNGFAFVITCRGKNKGTVSATWLLKEVGMKKDKKTGKMVAQYEKEIVRGNKDPFHMSDSFNQLPGELVPVGHTWERKGRQGSMQFVRKFKFTRIKSYRGQRVAQIDVKGIFTRRGEKVGKQKIQMLFDYKRGVMMKYTNKQNTDTKYPLRKSKKKGVGGILERSMVVSSMDVVKTNAKRRKYLK